MRPDPREQFDRDDSSRIIHLGEVRRRRRKRRHAPDQHYLILVVLTALTGWAFWLAILFTVNPSRLLSYLVFLAPLSVALAATGTLLSYAVDWRRGVLPDLAVCVRRGILGTAVAVSNLSLLAAHRWGIVAGAISVGVAVLIDLGIARRQAR